MISDAIITIKHSKAGKMADSFYLSLNCAITITERNETEIRLIFLSRFDQIWPQAQGSAGDLQELLKACAFAGADGHAL